MVDARGLGLAGERLAVAAQVRRQGVLQLDPHHLAPAAVGFQGTGGLDAQGEGDGAQRAGQLVAEFQAGFQAAGTGRRDFLRL